MLNKEKQIKRQNSYIAKKYDRLGLTFPKGMKNVYKQLAESNGMSLNAYINFLLDAELKLSNIKEKTTKEKT